MNTKYNKLISNWSVRMSGSIPISCIPDLWHEYLVDSNIEPFSDAVGQHAHWLGVQADDAPIGQD
jgi:hypothetical protein